MDQITDKKLVVVLGMHRSGTSVITRGLCCVNVTLGNRLIPPAEDNDKGFWEDIDINNLNVEMMSLIGKDWHHLGPILPSDVELLKSKGYVERAIDLLNLKLSNVRCFGFKDPRTAKLFEFWKNVFKVGNYNVSYILALRNPLSVVRSLEKRDKFEEEKSFLLWIDHVICSLECARGNEFIIIDYDLLMTDPDFQIDRISKYLQLEINEKELDLYKSEFLEFGLQHTIYDPNDILKYESSSALVYEIYTSLLNVAKGINKIVDDEIVKKITQWTSEFSRLKTALQLVDKNCSIIKARDEQISLMDRALLDKEEKIAVLDQSLLDKDDNINRLNQLLLEKEDKINGLNQNLLDRDSDITNILSSRSWKVTIPLRWIGMKLRAGVNLIRRFKNFFVLISPHALRAIKQPRWGLSKTIKALKVIRKEGVYGLRQALTRKQQEICGYDEWVKLYGTLTEFDRKAIRNRISCFDEKPLISILMPVYNTPEIWLSRAIDSVRSQLYENWELCIADDASSTPHVRKILEKYKALDKRIHVCYRKINGHISATTNSALELASGQFVAMLDHDDEISEHALYLVVEEINKNKKIDFLYSDQDKIDINNRRYDPYFKPDYNPDLLRSQNYVDHFAVFRTSIVRDLGGWRSDFDGSQDYDLVLRFIEKTVPENICHIPYVTYHWRAVPGSLAVHVGEKNYAAIRSRQALIEHLERLSVSAVVTSNYPEYSIHRVIYPIPNPCPLVSIIIPTKDGLDYLSKCVNGVLSKTDYDNFEVIIVDNNSEKKETFDYFREISKDARVRILKYENKFNYSKINNYAVGEAKGEIIALLNNDIEVINSDWLTEMVGHALRKEIGAVGARLYYADDTVQHAGVFLGYRNLAGHLFRYSSRHWMGIWARSVLVQNFSAVTAACMVLRRNLFLEVGGFDEEKFTVTFNDVDLCLRIYEKGYRNVYTPYAELYHFESKTRGTLAYQCEEDYFSKRWKHLIDNDPAYNLNLTLDAEDHSPAFPPRVKHPWLDNSPKLKDYPLVSIITRTHGERQNFLKESIESILNQTYRPIQLIIVEDGTCNARSVLDNISFPEGITVDYESLPKKGRCFAGNRGQELARGTFVGFLDDDDLLLPNHIETLVAILLNNPSASGAYSSAWEVPTKLISLNPLVYEEEQKIITGHDFSIQSLWNYNYIPIQAILFRKDLYFKYGGFVEDLDCLEDWDLWLRYTSESDFIFVNQITSLYRMPSDEKVLLERRSQHFKYIPTIRQRQKEILKKYKKSEHYKRLKDAYNLINE